MRIGSLFAGIGGFDLAARWVGWETAWFSEIDPYASAVLAKHWPGVPNHGDITAIDFTAVEPVDLLCGGFPCQDISNAGKREGIGGKRSGLWSEYARAIGELRPRYVVVENVAAILGRGVERVLGDLAALGYDAEWEVLSAADVGAPHLRERLWIVAYADSKQHQGHASAYQRSPSPVVLADARIDGRLRLGLEEHGDEQGAPGGQSDGRGPRRRGSGPGWSTEAEELADAEGQPERAGLRQNPTPGFGRGGLSGRREQDAGRSQSGRIECVGWWAVEPDVGRVAHGVPARVDRLTCLGNSLVPSCARVIFQAIQAREDAVRSRLGIARKVNASATEIVDGGVMPLYAEPLVGLEPTTAPVSDPGPCNSTARVAPPSDPDCPAAPGPGAPKSHPETSTQPQSSGRAS